MIKYYLFFLSFEDRPFYPMELWEIHYLIVVEINISIPVKFISISITFSILIYINFLNSFVSVLTYFSTYIIVFYGLHNGRMYNIPSHSTTNLFSWLDLYNLIDILLSN